ncbi:MAG: ABC transporter ATP-binding protein [Oscillospiraceae bacterium]
MKKETWLHTVFRFVRPSRARVSIAVLLETISVFCGILPYYGVYRIIRMFFEGTQSVNSILWAALLCLIGSLCKPLLHGVASMLAHRVAYRTLEGLRLAMAENLLKAPLGTVLNQTVGRLKNVIVDKVETIELPLAHMISEGIGNILFILAVYAYLIYINPWMALATLATVPIAFISYAIVMRTYNQKYAAFMEASDHVNSVIVEYIEGIEVIKAFGRSGSSYEKFKLAVESFKDFTLDWYRSTWAGLNFGNSVLPSTMLGTLPVGLLLYTQGLLAPAELVLCILLAMGIVGPFTSFTVMVNDLKSIQFSVSGAKSLLDTPPLQEVNAPAVLDGSSIQIQDVSFTYESGKEALRDISLTVPSGSLVALVGPSGGGKSTAAKLVARFWDVADGSIKIGGAGVLDMPLSRLNDLVSYVAQDNFLFNCSLLENIRLGKPGASDSAVYAAAKAAQCDEFIRALPKGYNTPAGEAGGRLSGGERQRISIARAILKDAPIILLDEATAFTDPENEDKIQKSIAELAHGKTLLVIAHRLSTIKNADAIVVLKDGGIHSAGTHTQLLQNDPLYESMWKAHIGAKQWAAGSKQEVADA